MLVILSQQISVAQYKLSGKVNDGVNKTPVENATVEIDNVAVAQTAADGVFSIYLTKKGTYQIKISSVGYKTTEQKIVVSASSTKLDFTLDRNNLFLKPIEITAIRAGSRSPFAKTNLSKAELEKTNLGQDIPFLLNQTPSVVINSDAGNGIGYTGIRIRGTDATRINMTLNGIPFNDAESQGSYFVDIPDFTSSVNSIQVQRGVGTSSNGAGAFGATINLSTNEFRDKPYAELNSGAGSFSTWRETIKAGTGLLNNHFTIDARVSQIKSAGFIERGSSDLQSGLFSAAYYAKKTSIRLNVILGKEKTYQAWNGIPEAKLKGDAAGLEAHYWNNVGYLYYTKEDSLNLFNPNNNRSYNYFTYKNQTDNYWQKHFQLFFNHEINKKLNLNVALFLTPGRGYYEEYKYQQELGDYGLTAAGSADLIRRLWLKNYFYGATYSLQYKNEKDQFTVGGALTKYDGNHYGNIIWSEATAVPTNYEWYRHTANKTDLSVYTKYQHRLNLNWELFADVQYRHVSYDINGFRKNPTIVLNNNYDFVNPKVGISYADTKGWLGFASFSVGNKEPNREDFETGTTQLPKPETMYDFELNIERKTNLYNWSATAYWMQYKNQLILTGRINDVGEYTRTNAPESFRKGIELQGGLKVQQWFNVAANLTLSSNRVLNFTEYVDDYDNGGQKQTLYKSAPLSLSPNTIAGVTFNFVPVKHAEISLLNKYVSRQYLDNTGNASRSIDPFFVSDLRLSYGIRLKNIKEINFTFQLNNVFNKKYEANGYTYSYIYGGSRITENFLYPMAGTNFLAGVQIKL